jgi:hypothetical protein
MVQQNNLEELLTAWRALQGLDTIEGWRSIPISPKLSLRLRAGRRFPENEEALLFAFSSTCIPEDIQLPQGGGFRVSRVELEGEASNLVWIALSKLQAGSLDLFLTMVKDIFSVLGSLTGDDEKLLFRTLLTRIITWQDFMERGRLPILSAEAEIGLVGELGLLGDLIKTGVPVQDAVESWQGPLNGIWDFETRRGAVEVKSTLSSNGFPVIIGSLDQLDDSRLSPLFLIGIRLVINDSGSTLPEIVYNLREKMMTSPTTVATFTRRLLLVGFSDLYADQYVNRFLRINEKIFLIDETFPRLTRMDVPSEITDVSYTLDLDKLRITPLHPDDIIKQFEVLWKWN